MAESENDSPPSGLDILPEFLREVFNPAPLETFQESIPEGEIEILLHRRPDTEPDVLTIRNVFPFFTLKDLKLLLWNELGREDNALPEFVYLCTQKGPEGKPYLGSGTRPADYNWVFPEFSRSRPLPAPFEIAGGRLPPDSRFVDSVGERKLVSIAWTDRLTLEDAFLRSWKSPPQFHAYFYSDLQAAFKGVKPISQLDWNGRFYPYFPYLNVENDAPTQRQRDHAKRLYTILQGRQSFLTRLEDLLVSTLQLAPLSVVGLRLLRLTWAAKKEIPGIEALFYEAPVTAVRPYMRLLPTEGQGISKLYFPDGKGPDIQDPTLLLNWTQERNPTPEQDYAFSKLLIRKGQANVPSLYSTLRLFNDGSADVILEPPRGVKRLDPRSDLTDFGDALKEGLADFPYLTQMPEIGNAMLILGLRLKKDSEVRLSVSDLRSRIPIFSAFFQEIQALPGESPDLMLRFKLVSNFKDQTRIQAFVSQLMSRKKYGLREIIQFVADEFQLEIEEAEKIVADQMRSDQEVALVSADTKDYMLQYNPGIDLAIYAQPPNYSFHLYRVNSLENLKRILTAISLLMSATDSDLAVNPRTVKAVRAAEVAESKYEAEEEESAAEGAGEEEDEKAGAAAAAAEEEESLPAEEEDDASRTGGADEFDDALDLLMGADVEEEVEKEGAARATARAVLAEGAPVHDPLREAPAAVSFQERAPARELRASLAEDRVSAREEVAGLPAVEVRPGRGSAPPAAAAPAKPAGPPPPPVDLGTISIANYFITKLQEADSRLFSFKKKHPSDIRYVTGCQPTYGRQPAVLSEEKFQDMEEEYAKDNVVFQIFPLDPGEPDTIAGASEKEVYTVLRYGTSATQQNYYICCRYFCVRDEIMIREVDLESRVMRRPEGEAKLPGECPFCRGKVIRGKVAGPNETIIDRPPAQDKVRRHSYIRFMSKTSHPEGFYLPCCHLDFQPVRFSHPGYEKYKEWGIPPKPARLTLTAVAAAADEEEEEFEEGVALEEQVGSRIEPGYIIVGYPQILQSADRRYIVGAEKLPLQITAIRGRAEGEPQIGLLPALLDEYFEQDQTKLVSRAFNPQKLKPDAKGFLRVAVENRLRNINDSLLAALAPFYDCDSATKLKQRILERVTPRVFLGLNMGNLVLEFYDPANRSIPHPTDTELRNWASNELNVDMSSETRAAILRAYLSYYNFRQWLISTDTKKEFRQFALLCSQSSLLREGTTGAGRGSRAGITFIVLHLTEAGKLEVRCPPYGLNPDLVVGNDIAFLFHHHSGIWEPIFYVNNDRTDREERKVPLATLTFLRQNLFTRASWPDIVKRRVQEYIAQCSSGGRAAYTSQGRIHPMAMLPANLVYQMLLKDFLKIPKSKLVSVLRDSYNHLGALIYHEAKGPRGETLGPNIPIPVVDDGKLFFETASFMRIFLDWDDPSFVRAPVDVVVKFYREYIETKFKLYPGYSPKRIVFERDSGQITALQLANGLFIPVGPASSEAGAAEIADLPRVEVDEFEWTINHELSLDDTSVEIPGEKYRLEVQEFNEIFEHLRLTFSNWYATLEEGGQFRKEFEATLFSRKLPLFEKRKRLEMILLPLVQKWITTDDRDEESNPIQTSLLRADCQLKAQGACGGRCMWKQGAEEGAGRCLLHVPRDVPMGEDRRVSAPRVLLLRLIEELLRFGERRRQLLHQDVTQLAALDNPVTLQDPGKVAVQIIYPEKSQAWYEFLRLEWARKADEAPRYYEEMSQPPEAAKAARPAGTAVAAAAVAPVDDATRLPDILFEFLGGAADPKVGRLRLIRAPFVALFAPLRIVPSQVGVPEEAQELTLEQINEIVRSTSGRTIVQLDARSAEAVRTPLARKQFGLPISHHPGVPVFVVTSTGPALLVTNPQQPGFLTMEEMPKPLLDIVMSAKGKAFVKPLAPGPARPRVAAAPLPPPEAAVAAAGEEAVPRARTVAEMRAERARKRAEEEEAAAGPAPEEEEKEKSAEAEAAAAAEEAVAPPPPPPPPAEDEEKSVAAEKEVAAEPEPAPPPPPSLASLARPKTIQEMRDAKAAERAAKEVNEQEEPAKVNAGAAIRAAALKRRELAAAAAARTAAAAASEGKSAESSDSLSPP